MTTAAADFRLVADYRMTGDQPWPPRLALPPYGRLRMSWVPIRRSITFSPSNSKVSR